ncbi:hypothetical protein DPMN_019699 [Dreissena polymorpha]|uniref:Uncharacterized protein n=1 Tax=Dreissena polymorpha TaxID=45954 RepID=A0A9D4NLA3_DREPO|nr:hypothetical protein DPMN_019699 [Dreissena polymorpha]
MQEKALNNNSSFVVWSSTPFDSQPEESRTQTRLLSISARPACHISFLSFRNSARRHLASDYQASYQYLLPCWLHQHFQQSLGEFDFRLSIDVA